MNLATAITWTFATLGGIAGLTVILAYCGVTKEVLLDALHGRLGHMPSPSRRETVMAVATLLSFVSFSIALYSFHNAQAMSIAIPSPSAAPQNNQNGGVPLGVSRYNIPLQAAYRSGLTIKIELESAATDAAVNKGADNVDAWFNSINGWLAATMGPPAVARFDQNSSSLDYAPPPRPARVTKASAAKRNVYLNRITDDLVNLQMLMTGAFDPQP